MAGSRSLLSSFSSLLNTFSSFNSQEVNLTTATNSRINNFAATKNNTNQLIVPGFLTVQRNTESITVNIAIDKLDFINTILSDRLNLIKKDSQHGAIFKTNTDLRVTVTLYSTT